MLRFLFQPFLVIEPETSFFKTTFKAKATISTANASP